MNFYNILLIALALAMDAFAVALSIGINCEVKRNNKFCFLISFAFFQFLFAFIGAFFGKFFNEKILSVPSIVGGIIIILVGAMMIKEGLEGDEEEEECLLIRPKMYVILGVSVSIDALVVGFTALYSRGSYILQDTLVVGLITFIMVFLAFIVSRYLQKLNFVVKYADYLGGVILILFGLKMIFL